MHCLAELDTQRPSTAIRATREVTCTFVALSTNLGSRQALGIARTTHFSMLIIETRLQPAASSSPDYLRVMVSLTSWSS